MFVCRCVTVRLCVCVCALVGLKGLCACLVCSQSTLNRWTCWLCNSQQLSLLLVCLIGGVFVSCSQLKEFLISFAKMHVRLLSNFKTCYVK